MIRFTLTILGLMFALAASSQIISEDFDSYTDGDKIGVVSSTDWTTWSGATGGGEDGTISTTNTNTAPNALHVVNNNDVVLLFNDLTTSRYLVEFKILITTGNIGYFNLLQDFNEGDSEWGTQFYFNPGGVGYIDAGASKVDTFSFSYDTWIDVNIIVDLDDDYATIYLDDVERVSWKWSTGTFGDGTLNKLDALNIYGTTEGGSSDMYIDDFVFSEVTAPVAPTTLTATLNVSDVDLAWTEPTPTPDSYTIMSNNIQLINNVTTITHTHVNPYPTSYVYNVRAHTTGLGYSHSSNDAEIEIAGGVDRQYVLFEIGTGTECGYCPGAAMGAHDLIANGDQAAILEYHSYNSGDLTYDSQAAADRASYYAMQYYPTSIADGVLKSEGGSATESLFDSYHAFYTQRYEKSSLHTISATITNTDIDTYLAEITVVQSSAYNTESKRLHTALTESDIQQAWQNQTELHWVCRNMFPDATGTTADFSSDDTQEFSIEFTIDPTYVKDNCEFVVFLQADPSKEVLQALKIDMVDIPLAVNTLDNNSNLRLFPNPSNDIVNFNTNVDANYSITDVTGKIIKTGYTTNSINISELTTGVYFVKIEGNITTYKLFKK